jgi:integrase
MTWSEVDLREGTWILPSERSKNSQEHLVPLVPAMLADNILRPKLRTGNYVFASGRIGDKPVDSWDLFKSKLAASMREDIGEIPRWTYHDLRRTAASAWGDHSVVQHVISLLLGHSTDKDQTATSIDRSVSTNVGACWNGGAKGLRR